MAVSNGASIVDQAKPGATSNVNLKTGPLGKICFRPVKLAEALGTIDSMTGNDAYSRYNLTVDSTKAGALGMIRENNWEEKEAVMPQNSIPVEFCPKLHPIALHLQPQKPGFLAAMKAAFRSYLPFLIRLAPIFALATTLRAQAVLIELDGKVGKGTDNGALGFAPNTDLTDMRFILIFSVDPTKAEMNLLFNSGPPYAPYGSSITGTNANSPVIAELRIGGGTKPFYFGPSASKSISSMAQREIRIGANTGSSADERVDLEYGVEDDSGSAYVVGHVGVEPDEPALTYAPDWRVPL